MAGCARPAQIYVNWTLISKKSSTIALGPVFMGLVPVRDDKAGRQLTPVRGNYGKLGLITAQAQRHQGLAALGNLP
jgi:hypothetical protein